MINRKIRSERSPFTNASKRSAPAPRWARDLLLDSQRLLIFRPQLPSRSGPDHGLWRSTLRIRPGLRRLRWSASARRASAMDCPDVAPRRDKVAGHAFHHAGDLAQVRRRTDDRQRAQSDIRGYPGPCQPVLRVVFRNRCQGQSQRCRLGIDQHQPKIADVGRDALKLREIAGFCGGDLLIQHVDKAPDRLGFGADQPQNVLQPAVQFGLACLSGKESRSTAGSSVASSSTIPSDLERAIATAPSSSI